MWNKVNQTTDLLVTNFSESDLGLYYCALRERKPVKDETGAEVLRDVYHNGTRTTRLSLLGEKKDSEGKNGNKENQKRTKHGEAGGADGEADGVVYTQVNITSRRQNHLKRNRVELSDICTYSEVVNDQTSLQLQHFTVTLVATNSYQLQATFSRSERRALPGARSAFPVCVHLRAFIFDVVRGWAAEELQTLPSEALALQSRLEQLYVQMQV
ncbi:hypothetical protein NFI96_006995 [Prochilodus magdalenae]|nr:hypothetical protein NFI96_006995 [Prochilodus magdalenae]